MDPQYYTRLAMAGWIFVPVVFASLVANGLQAWNHLVREALSKDFNSATQLAILSPSVIQKRPSFQHIPLDAVFHLFFSSYAPNDFRAWTETRLGLVRLFFRFARAHIMNVQAKPQISCALLMVDMVTGQLTGSWDNDAKATAQALPSSFEK